MGDCRGWLFFTGVVGLVKDGCRLPGKAGDALVGSGDWGRHGWGGCGMRDAVCENGVALGVAALALLPYQITCACVGRWGRFSLGRVSGAGVSAGPCHDIDIAPTMASRGADRRRWG